MHSNQRIIRDHNNTLRITPGMTQDTDPQRLIIDVNQINDNKTGTSGVGDVSKAQKAQR